MSVKSCFVAVLLFAGLAFSPLLAQQKPVTGASGQAAPAVQDFSKEAFVIEHLSTTVTAEADGTGSREVSAEVKVLADAGVKAFAVLNFTYTSANEEVEIEYVRVRKPDGTVVKTPDYNIQDMPGEVTRTAPLYSDIHEKHIAVKGLGVGDVLESLVRYRIVKPLVPGHFWTEYSFTKDAIAKDERLEISVPSGKYVKIVSSEFQPEIAQDGERKIYRWKHSNLEVAPKDPNQPPRRIPLNPDVQVTTFASWEDVGRWYGELQKDPLQVTAAIQAKASELTKGLPTDDEKIHAIYKFVSLKVHYVGLDFGIGRYQPHAADDVLDNGYGDCKDKHTLLASLLKAAGIDAYPALIHASRTLDADVPSPAQFNHVITVVPRGDKFLWMDTTPEVAPYAFLMIGLRNKQALVIPTHGAPVLMVTPANPPFEEMQDFSVEGELGADGTFTGHMELTMHGDVEVILRAALRSVSQSQWKEAIQRFSYGMNFGGEVSNVNMTSPDDIDQPFKLSYDYVRNNYSDWEHKQIIAPLPPVGLEAGKDDRQKKPVDPVLLGAVGKLVYHSRMELPPGYFAVAPDAIHLSESYADYNDTSRIEKGVLTTRRELVIKKNEVPLSDWEGFRKFGQAISEDEFKFLTLTAAGALPTWLTPETQEDRLRTAYKNSPGDPALAAALGSFLIQAAKYEDAEKVLESSIAVTPDNASTQYLLGQAYLDTGDNDKGVAHLKHAIEQKDDDAMMLNNVAYAMAEKNVELKLARQYAEGAVDELDDEAPGAEPLDEAGLQVTYGYSLTWDTLGWVYFQQGDLADAEKFVRAAWLLGEESLVADHLGQIYEKEGKKQQAVRAYESGLAASPAPIVPTFGTPQNPALKTAQKEADAILARYEKLTGKKPEMMVTRRLPNGEWTQTPAEQLLHSRQVKVSNAGKLSGSAQFIVRIKPGKAGSAHLVSGDEVFKSLGAKLTEARYPVEFPSDSGTILVLRLSINCHADAPCVATLVNPTMSSSQWLAGKH
jgi:tetratricopeptide (TPR) repeat protein/transglutaminase-like putative cysteine protease